jgi:predicted ATPase
VFNEPETSLHTDVLPALGDLIATAAEHAQVVVTTHSSDLADHLVSRADATAHHLVRNADGSTSLT